MVMQPEDMTDEQVTGFNDDEVLPRVDNVDQMVRDVEFQGVYTSSELARLRQFVKDSKTPLYPGCKKYSRLSGDLKLLQLKAAHQWTNRSFKQLLDLLKDILPEGNQVADSVYEAKKIICPLGLEVEKIMHVATVVCCSAETMQPLTLALSVVRVGTRGKQQMAEVRVISKIHLQMKGTRPRR